MDDYQKAYLNEHRSALVRHLRRTVSDPRVLAAFTEVPREAFVPEAQLQNAYDDRALPLAEGQTISQPTMIAIMLESLEVRDNDAVLEVGAGSGYAAALLGKLARVVHAIEIRPALAARAKATLEELGISNVTIHVGDGSHGLSGYGPFDRILVSAGAEHIPSQLVDQLSPGGRIVIPVGDSSEQELRIGTRPESGGEIEWRTGVPCIFVPLVET